MYCQNCGAELLDGDQYCQGCGTPVGDGGETAGTATGQGNDPTARTASHGTAGGRSGQSRGTGQQQYGQQPNAGGPQGGRGGGPRGQGPANRGGHQHGGGHGAADSGTITVRTEADRYLKKYAILNLAMAILSAFVGLLFVALGSALQSMAPLPPGFDALLGVFYVIMFAIAALYAAVWYFAKRRSAAAVYGGTALYGIGTLLNAISLNIIAFPITLLGLYWGYKSFDAV
jgi:hypothetical protein